MICLSKKIGRIALIGLFIMGLFLFADRVYARELSMQSALREITGKISSLFTLRANRELAEKEKLEQELQTRKDALDKIFELTLMEQKDLLSRLSALKNLSDPQEKMNVTLTNLLQENENTFSEISSRLESVENIDDAKKLANDFKNWRTLVYNPKAEKAAAFTFVFQTKNILTIARQRLDQISEDLKSNEKINKNLKESAQEFLNKSEIKITEAEELSEQARNIILIGLANEFAYANKNIVSKNIKKSIARDIADAKSFTEKSLQNVQDAYGLFLDLGEAVNN